MSFSSVSKNRGGEDLLIDVRVGSIRNESEFPLHTAIRQHKTGTVIVGSKSWHDAAA